MQAEAFASAFASADTCNCDVSVSADVRVWDEIWVEAVANAYAETCSGALPFSMSIPYLADMIQYLAKPIYCCNGRSKKRQILSQNAAGQTKKSFFKADVV